MTLRGRLILLGTAAALCVAQSPALASAHAPHQAVSHGQAKGHTHTTATTTTPSPTKAYGKYCQTESKKHVAGTPGTPFSKCVTDLAHLATGKAANPRRACANESHKHSANSGKPGTPYSNCVKAAAQLQKTMAASSGSSTTATPMAISAPRGPGIVTSTKDASTDCTLPDGTSYNYYHCYTPQDIRSAYGVDKVAPLANGMTNEGQGQTIVLMDSYGSPTATQDLDHFQQTFFPSEGTPNFTQVFPNGNPQYNNACSSAKGQSGPCAAANWSGEATLDIEWAYSIAPKAHIVLVAVPPAETEGVQGLPNLFKALAGQVNSEPSGTLFSMSFGVTEQTLSPSQVSKFDAVFQQGKAKNDTFFASSGDNGSTGTSKQHKDTTNYSYPTVGWPASSPWVTSVGGTQLQYGWTWDPSSNDPSTAAYWNSIPGDNTQTVWNESWAPIGTGGGASTLYQRPTWQTADPGYGNHRLVPDTSWNAAVNGGVDVYITAYPQYNCGNATGCWTFFGGTSAASPQTAGLTALVNASRESAGKSPIGYLNPILYSGFGASGAYKDILPMHEGTAPPVFAGSDVGVGTVNKSVGDLVDNQLWESPVAGYPTTQGYDATTGWGAPVAPQFVAGLTAQP